MLIPCTVWTGCRLCFFFLDRGIIIYLYFLQKNHYPEQLVASKVSKKTGWFSNRTDDFVSQTKSLLMSGTTHCNLNLSLELRTLAKHWCQLSEGVYYYYHYYYYYYYYVYNTIKVRLQYNTINLRLQYNYKQKTIYITCNTMSYLKYICLTKYAQ